MSTVIDVPFTVRESVRTAAREATRPVNNDPQTLWEAVKLGGRRTVRYVLPVLPVLYMSMAAITGIAKAPHITPVYDVKEPSKPETKVVQVQKPEAAPSTQFLASFTKPVADAVQLARQSVAHMMHDRASSPSLSTADKVKPTDLKTAELAEAKVPQINEGKIFAFNYKEGQASYKTAKSSGLLDKIIRLCEIRGVDPFIFMTLAKTESSMGRDNQPAEAAQNKDMTAVGLTQITAGPNLEWLGRYGAQVVKDLRAMDEPHADDLEVALKYLKYNPQDSSVTLLSDQYNKDFRTKGDALKKKLQSFRSGKEGEIYSLSLCISNFETADAPFARKVLPKMPQYIKKMFAKYGDGVRFIWMHKWGLEGGVRLAVNQNAETNIEKIVGDGPAKNNKCYGKRVGEVLQSEIVKYNALYKGFKDSFTADPAYNPPLPATKIVARPQAQNKNG